MSSYKGVRLLCEPGTDNYTIWSGKMKAKLKMKDVWNVVETAGKGTEKEKYTAVDVLQT